jgi:DNA polymerase III subunit beta
MKLTIERAALLKSLAHVQSVVERRNTIPILANVLLRAHGDGQVELVATDMDLDILEQVKCATASEGATTAPAHTLYDIVRKLPEGSEIQLDGGGAKERLIVRAGRSTFTLPALPTADFPVLASDGLPFKFSLGAAVLRSLIDRTRVAISTEETRYYLNGIYLHATQSNELAVLRAVATDGHRLARVEEPLPEGAGSMPGVIVPRKTVNELRKLLDEVTGEVDIALSETRIQFRVGPITLTSKLIDGTFPEYERVIPRDNDKILRVGKKDFADAVARVAAISSERSRPVKLSLARDLLVLSASSPDQGTATEELDGDRVSYAAGPLEIGFQARYLNDITDQIVGDVEFRFSDGAAPTVVVDAADASALYVLMPMRV